MKIFIGMETSGQVRRRVAAMGHEVISCDLLPAIDDQPIIGTHIVGDVFETLERLRAGGWWPDAALFHPECTYLTASAEWAYKDPDFDRYPGVGYHQRLKPGTLFGADRRAARVAALKDWARIDALPITRKIAENPAYGALSKGFRRPDQVVHPFQLGDDASKATGIWRWNAPALVIDPSAYVEPRLVCENMHTFAYGLCKCPQCGSERYLPRWANQTDTGQNRLSPGADRWQKRSETYPGIADALAEALTHG